MKLERLSLILFLLLACAKLPYAQSSNLYPKAYELPAKQITAFNLTTDQDFFPPGSTDHNYTMGVLFNWYGPGTNRPLFLLPYPLELLDGGVSWLSGCERELATSGFHFGYSAFTPEKLAVFEQVLDDRPYSGILNFQSSRVYTFKDYPRWAMRTRFMVAILGTYLGHNVQSAIHYIQSKRDSFDMPIQGSARPIPHGWKHQIGNGGGLTAMYSNEFVYDLMNVGNKPSYLHANLKGGFSLGMYTNISLGMEMRLGLLSPLKRAWHTGINVMNLTDKKKRKRLRGEPVEKPHPKEIEIYPELEIDKAPFYPKPNTDIRRTFELFLHSELKGNFWAENTLLTGDFMLGPKNFTVPGPFYSGDCDDRVMMRALNAEFFLGLVLRINYFECSYGGVIRSAELAYTDQEVAATGRGPYRNMVWGQLSFGWRL